MNAFKTIWFRFGLGVGLLLIALWWFLSALHDAYDLGYSKASSEGNFALEKLRGEHLALELTRTRQATADAKDAAKRLHEEQARNDKLASQLAELKRQYRQNTDQLIGEIARVNDLYREALDSPPKPLPACVFTAGWVRVYDEATGAISPEMPTASNSGRVAAQGTNSDAAWQLDSGISQAAVLAHHVKYAEQCRATSAQLGLLIDAVNGE